MLDSRYFTPIKITATKTGRRVPPGWQTYRFGDDSTWTYIQPEGLRVMESVSDQQQYSDGKRWHHISVSLPDRLPSWSDLEMVKRIFMGHEVTALQILPPVRKYVNHHPFCLHLWRCLDGDVTPDFSTVIEGVRHV